ncbi:glycosyltransferase involved in cell wall biosynthesis [Lachnotalea glycerini]|uniref:Glycosyltransferase n=1 Tax=Lachnotalea glycerini TaxID=1763509 RepID=A0A255IE64_9FIRM|nr:glycosyltransferase [Lachnotalea glycerini]OYP43440.1 glycosyl transferase family 2 [Lachnotalea glycerini]PXV90315.1 glycosyltransferase involved in cell wall biosynthesis [Lachnotalea glycerini]RDY26683.1 glycosyltransferase [Lachnotalea glycerini]
MNKYKVAVYAICKNEAHFVDRWMDSMCEADEIYVTDTGSSDDTVQKLRNRGAIVNEINLKPWRFDVARNISLSFVSKDIDICVCTDLDEVLEPGWRMLIENVWTAQTTRLKYMYTWSFNSDNTPGVTFWYEKIHQRKDFRWIHPVHEVLHYYGTKPDIYAIEGKIQLNHYPDPAKSRGQYLELLEMSVIEDPEDDRNVHYLGREYMFYEMWDKCIETLKRHLQMPKASWRDERAASMRYIARAYKAKNSYKESTSWLYRAIAEAPYLREPYVEMAQLAYIERDWLRVYYMVEETLKIKEKPTTYINEASSWNETIYDLGAVSCYELGLYEKSLQYAEIAAQMSPLNQRLKRNFELIRQKVLNG